MRTANDIFSIARQIPALQVAQHEGIHATQRGNKWWACCPLHGEKTASLAFYEDGGFYCYGCGSGGDGIGLYAALYGLSQLEAARQVVQAFSLDGTSAPPPSPADRIREAQRWRRGELEELRALVARANDTLDRLTASAPNWDAAWDAPGFIDTIRARELLQRGIDELIFANNDELRQMMGGDAA